jgi:hypothetical protein
MSVNSLYFTRIPLRLAIGSYSRAANYLDSLSTFKLMEKHWDPSSLLALIKALALIKDICSTLDIFHEAREFGVAEGACEFRESVARTGDLATIRVWNIILPKTQSINRLY